MRGRAGFVHAHRRKSPRVFAAVIALAVATLAGCTRAPAPPYQQQLLAFGTLVDITIADTEPSAAQAAGAAAIRILNELHHRWHAWEPGPLTEINAHLAREEAVTLAPDQSEAIREAQRLSQESGALFNPAIGRLIGAWGFHADERPAGVPPPPPARVRELVAQHPTMADLHIDGDQLRSDNRTVQLDFGAYMKGYAVDRADDALRQRGIANAIINAGGELRAIGRRGDRPWHIGIRDPRGPGILAAIDIDGDESVYTSGDYERYFDYAGKRYQHIIDPRSGYPAEGAMSATVIYPGGGVGGGASTALMVAGPQGWREVVRGMQLKYAMLVASDRTVYMTPAMAKRMHFEIDPAPRVVIGEPWSRAPPGWPSRCCRCSTRTIGATRALPPACASPPAASPRSSCRSIHPAASRCTDRWATAWSRSRTGACDSSPRPAAGSNACTRAGSRTRARSRPVCPMASS